MNQSEFDSYRQQVWNQGAAIVDEHDARVPTATELSSQIARLDTLLQGFQAQYQKSRAPSGPISPDWIDPRFHDFYDFLLKILMSWKAARDGGVLDTTPGGGAGGSGDVIVPPIPSIPSGSRPVYRMILYTPAGDYGTSGTYFDGGIALCTPDTPNGCQSKTFPTVAEAVRWAVENNEIPVYIDLDWDPGVAEAWRIAAGGSPQPPKSFIVSEVHGDTVIPSRAGVGGSLMNALSTVPTAVWWGLGLIVVASRAGGRRS